MTRCPTVSEIPPVSRQPAPLVHLLIVWRSCCCGSEPCVKKELGTDKEAGHMQRGEASHGRKHRSGK